MLVRAALQRLLPYHRDLDGPRVREAGAFTAATAVYQACRLSLMIAAAAVLGPATFGVWVLLVVLVQYSGALGLGITNGAGREIPYLRGGGQEHEAHLVESAGWGGAVLTALGAGSIAFMSGWVLVTPDVEQRPLVVGLFAVAVALQQPLLFGQAVLRSSFRFGAAAVQLAVMGLVLLVTGAALLRFGVAGLMAALTASTICGLLVAVRRSGGRGRPIFRRDVIRRLIGIGLPIMVAGLIFALLTTLDRWLVLVFLGIDAVGVYGLAGMAISGLLLVPAVLGQQTYPRLAFAHGAGSPAADLRGMAERQGRLIAAAVVGLAIPTGLAAAVGVPVFLPAYEEAVPALIAGLAAVVAYGSASGYANLLNTVGAYRRYLAVQVISLVVDLTLSVLALAAGLRLFGVALALLASMVTYGLLLRRAAAEVSASPSPVTSHV